MIESAAEKKKLLCPLPLMAGAFSFIYNLLIAFYFIKKRTGRNMKDIYKTFR